MSCVMNKITHRCRWKELPFNMRTSRSRLVAPARRPFTIAGRGPWPCPLKPRFHCHGMSPCIPLLDTSWIQEVLTRSKWGTNLERGGHKRHRSRWTICNPTPHSWWRRPRLDNINHHRIRSSPAAGGWVVDSWLQTRNAASTDSSRSSCMLPAGPTISWSARAAWRLISRPLTRSLSSNASSNLRGIAIASNRTSIVPALSGLPFGSAIFLPWFGLGDKGCKMQEV